MNLTVLVDNNTFIDQYYLGEPALSFYIEDGAARVLFDAGYSDAFLQNAAKLGVDLSQVTQIVLSHGHDDHTQGLRALFAGCDCRAVPLVAHPDCFWPKRKDGLAIGAPYGAAEVAAHTVYQPSREPVRLTERLTFLGEIPRRLDFERSYAMGERLRAGAWEADLLSEDSALVYEGARGLFVITGCSHSGICNIIEQARAVTGVRRVAGVIGGFHLFADDARLAATIRYFQDCEMRWLYPCHCVSLAAKARMIGAGLPVEEVGVGMQIEVE